jgi:tripartite-type tricarboxylate transporter receptor subunit TctC
MSQDAYPSRPIRLIVPVAAGGAGDVATRLVAQPLSVRLGQPIVIENRVGAGGAIGAASAAKAPPDGYTLTFASVAFNLMGVMQANLPFDPDKDLSPIGLFCSQSYLFLARADAPYKTVPEFVAYAKAHPGDVRFAHAGVGTLTHLFGVWLAGDAGIQLNEIPYSGVAPALNSLLAGQTDVYFGPLSSLPYVDQGKVRALAVTSERRADAGKNIPTLKELGYRVSGATWFGFMAPAETPKPIIDRLNTELNAVLQQGEVRQRLESLLYTVERTTPGEFARFYADQTSVWTQLVRSKGLKAQ